MFDSVVKCFLHYIPPSVPSSAKPAESKAETRAADLSSVHSQSDDSMGVFQLFQLLGAANLMDHQRSLFFNLISFCLVVSLYLLTTFYIQLGNDEGPVC